MRDWGGMCLRGWAAAGGVVLVQQGHAAEGPCTGTALVLLHLGVGLQVGAQVGAVGKSPVAQLTGKGTLTCGDKGQLASANSQVYPPVVVLNMRTSPAFLC